MKYTKQDIIRMADEEDVEFIRLQFTDMFGTLKNVAITRSQLEKAPGFRHIYYFPMETTAGKSCKNYL